MQIINKVFLEACAPGTNKTQTLLSEYCSIASIFVVRIWQYIKTMFSLFLLFTLNVSLEVLKMEGEITLQSLLGSLKQADNEEATQYK